MVSTVAGELIPRHTPPAGFEPATRRLTVVGSTAELQRIVVLFLCFEVEFIISLLHLILTIVTVLIVISFYFLFSELYLYNPLYNFIIYNLEIDIDSVSFGFLGSLLGFILIAIIFGPLFILLEINNTLKDSNKNLKNINTKITNKIQ